MGIISFFVVFSVFNIGYDGFLFKKNVNKHTFLDVNKKYPYSNQYFENYIRRLNSKNISLQHESILGETNNNNDKVIPKKNTGSVRCWVQS